MEQVRGSIYLTKYVRVLALVSMPLVKKCTEKEKGEREKEQIY